MYKNNFSSAQQRYDSMLPVETEADRDPDYYDRVKPEDQIRIVYVRKARKAHKCNHCHRMIATGSPYTAATIRSFSGLVWFMKYCPNCDHLLTEKQTDSSGDAF